MIDVVFLWCFPRLQDDYRRQQRDIEQTKEESGAMETRFQSLMARASRELAEKITELEELKTQVQLTLTFNLSIECNFFHSFI